MSAAGCRSSSCRRPPSAAPRCSSASGHRRRSRSTVARDRGLTLCGFARGGQVNVYTHPHRVSRLQLPCRPHGVYTEVRQGAPPQTSTTLPHGCRKSDFWTRPPGCCERPRADPGSSRLRRRRDVADRRWLHACPARCPRSRSPSRRTDSGAIAGTPKNRFRSRERFVVRSSAGTCTAAPIVRASIAPRTCSPGGRRRRSASAPCARGVGERMRGHVLRVAIRVAAIPQLLDEVEDHRIQRLSG